MLTSLLWFLLFFGGALALAYHRIDLRRATIYFGAAVLAYLVLGSGGWLIKLPLVLILAGLIALNLDEQRQSRITAPLLKVYRSMLPNMSATERSAIAAGTTWWDGDLFSGAPRWSKLLTTPAPKLTEEEQAFLDGPVEELCRMLDQWQITHELGDLPPEAWQFMKDKGFFAMIIPKSYGGLEFSAFAHSEVLIKIASRSATACSIVAVPNSLGPAELLLQYGTEEQKDHYLPRLATGEDVPCFALTAPRAGSDATSLTDSGVVCKGKFEGKEVIGIRLNWDKRYITLAPVATVLGLAFRLHDPDHLLGDESKEDYGITCALIPTDMPGITIGRRHFPVNIPFQNGPTQGKDVFVPVDYIIGGAKMAGQGWRMLVENLAVGRSISLPSNSTGGAKAATAATGAYARIRKQFNMPIGYFEGVQEAIARIVGHTYTMDAARTMTAGAVDLGEKPSVLSAIVKYHCTEMGRRVAEDAMDVHGGKGIMLGPRNYLARGYQVVPVAITVEGANILTRNMIIFGQGAIRCHPWVMKEMEAAANPDEEEGLREFDRALFGHIGYTLSNAARSLVLSVTMSKFSDAPSTPGTKRFYQHINRFAASFALLADAAMLTLGGSLKRREALSARLGDMLSYMYLASSVLKRFEDQGRPEADLPVVEYACRDLMYRCQDTMHELLRNFPNRVVALFLRGLVFPIGRTYRAPSDQKRHKVAALVLSPTETRERLVNGIYRERQPGNPIGLLDKALEMAVDVEPIEKRIRRAIKEKRISETTVEQQIDDAEKAEIIGKEEAASLREFSELVYELITVDDFDPHELGIKAYAAKMTSPAKAKSNGKKAGSRKRARRKPAAVASSQPPA
ncbi:MAG: acyl-CoA dehydrogenase [Gammaproteobacteria bacterium]|nr:acyl-CoA dehydrogenase [Gammaproteobacteria bacterium]